jgi:hypothetical protein
LDNALKITQNVELLFSKHPIQDSFQFGLHFSIYDSVSQNFRLDVLKTKGSLIEVKTLNHFDFFVPDNGLDRGVRLVMDNVLDRRHVLRTEGFHENVNYRRVLDLVHSIWPFRHHHLLPERLNLNHFLLVFLFAFSLEIVIFIVFYIRLKDKLFSPIISGDLFEVIALDLLGSSQ